MSTAPVGADEGIVGWVVGLMETLGAPGVGLAIALESVFPPLPSEVFLPLAGFAAARGDLSLVAAIVWTTIGSLAGALLLYGVGAALGRERMFALADRMPLVDVADVAKAEAWFVRHGPKAVFLGRMVPLVRSLVSVPAGVERMSLPLFAALTTAGSLIWNTAFVLAGYGLGANFGLIEPYMSVVSKVVLGLLVAAVAWYVVRRVLVIRRGRAETAAAAADRPAADPPAAGSAEAPVPGPAGAPSAAPVEAATVPIAVPTARVDAATVRFDRAGGHPHPARRPHPHAGRHPHPAGPHQPHPQSGPHSPVAGRPHPPSPAVIPPQATYRPRPAHQPEPSYQPQPRRP
ncbi:MAG TPA: VTT domain-containing protein [Pseudonocardia sp.]|nr:VTT domain-containing protein [Pseudonocardia sp.]